MRARPRRVGRERAPRPPRRNGGLVTTRSAAASARPAARRAEGAVTSATTIRARSASPFRSALSAASAAVSASISTRSTSRLRIGGAASASPTAPTPAPTSTTRRAGRAPAAAASSTASGPTRWPVRFCRSRRPGRRSRRAVSSHRAVRRPAPPRSADCRARAKSSCVDQDAARQEAERALDRAHVPVGDEIAQARALEQRFDEGDQHEIVGAHQFVQGTLARTRAGRAVNLPRRRVGLSMFAPLRVSARTGHVGQVIPLEEKSAARLIEPLTDLVAGDMALVNQTILSRTGSDVAMIPEVANHLISSGGKRLRPILTLATAALVRLSRRGPHQARRGGRVHAHRHAAARRRRRRQRHAARQGRGAGACGATGERAGRRLPARPGLQDDGRGRLARPALDVLSTAAAVIAEGEVMQLSAAKDTETTEDAYLDVIRAKTAALFAAACEVGPILARRPQGGDRGLPRLWRQSRHRLPAHRRRARLRRLVGQARQERRRRFPRGQDHAAGGAVVPARRDRPSANSGSARWSGARSRDGDLAIALRDDEDAIARIEDTIERARHYGAMARDALELFPASAWKHALLDAVEFAVAAGALNAAWEVSYSARPVAALPLRSVALSDLADSKGRLTCANLARLLGFDSRRGDPSRPAASLGVFQRHAPDAPALRRRPFCAGRRLRRARPCGRQSLRQGPLAGP